VLKDGLLQQCAPPRVLYDRPDNAFVAGFIGSPAMNLCGCLRGTNGTVSLGGADVPVSPAAAEAAAAQEMPNVVVGIRPEALDLASDGIAARVEVVEELGADAYVFCVADLPTGEAKLVARVDSAARPERGARVFLRPRLTEALLFDPVSGERLG
jgi:multiple sugar transport system ATP-binding protein